VKLAQLRRHALSLAGVEESPHFDRTSFRVNGKIFLTARAVETHVHVFLPEEQREPALAMHPEAVAKLMWGAKVVGLRIDLQLAPSAVTKDLVTAAWAHKASREPVRSLHDH